eukprot:snap_masked-scaffold_30-processed-gene-1.17-mRNA-1 protein AED:1.00 eAED:1.00 QI:0/-1/0/0/-1/1/1/0/63
MFPYLESYPQDSENHKRFTNKKWDEEDEPRKKFMKISKSNTGSKAVERWGYQLSLDERGNKIE